MIRISAFSPMENFARKSWEFYEDKLVGRTKSLTIDYETEVRYEQIHEIWNKKRTDLAWLRLPFIIIGLVGAARSVLNYFCLNIPMAEAAEKALIILGLALIAPAFQTYEVYGFLDSDQRFLAVVRVDKKHRKALIEAINLIKQRIEISLETYFSDPPPSTRPAFEITEFDFPDFLNTAKIGFYEDKIIQVEKSLEEELTTVIKYDELSGKTKFARIANKNWDNVWAYWLLLLCITTIPTAVFFSEQVSGSLLYTRLVLGGVFLLVAMFFLRYIKSDILVFYNRKDEGIFRLRVTALNREKLQQIVEFVQGKVAQT